MELVEEDDVLVAQRRVLPQIGDQLEEPQVGVGPVVIISKSRRICQQDLHAAP